MTGFAILLSLSHRSSDGPLHGAEDSPDAIKRTPICFRQSSEWVQAVSAFSITECRTTDVFQYECGD